MPSASHDYFRYLPCPDECKAWGLAVTAAGFTEIKPGTPYPPARHPRDHDFDWQRGRRLSALQIVSIQAGKGWFESEHTRLRRISTGSAFLVAPGIWHRYRPDPGTGWTESWVEIQGPAIPRLIHSQALRIERPLKRLVAATLLDEALHALHARVRTSTGKFDPALSASAFEILAAWTSIDRPRTYRLHTTQKIIDAEQYLAAHCSEPIDMESFSKKLGIAYSHFRKLFRIHTGYAPWEYVRRTRLVRARRQLLRADSTLEEIASELGFSSAFHFSNAFKAAFGIPPSVWRKHQLQTNAR